MRILLSVADSAAQHKRRNEKHYKVFNHGWRSRETGEHSNRSPETVEKYPPAIAESES